MEQICHALLPLCIIKHALSLLAFLGVHFQGQGPVLLFVCVCVLLINKRQIKLLKLAFSLRTLLYLDASDSEVTVFTKYYFDF